MQRRKAGFGTCHALLGSIFKACTWVGVPEQKLPPAPKAIVYFCTQAFMDGAFHSSVHRGTKRLTVLFQYPYLQAVFPLADTCPRGRPCFNFSSPISRQPIFPAMVKDCANTAGKATHRQRNCCRRKHQAVIPCPVPAALCPKIGVRERPPAIGFKVSRPARKA